MKLSLLAALCGTACLWAAADPVPAIRVPLQFASPALRATDFGTYAITLPGLMNTLEAGMPAVPVKTFKLALPPGTTSVDVQVIPSRAHQEKVVVERAFSQLPFSWPQRAPRLAHRMDPEGMRAIPGGVYPAKRADVSLQTLHHTPIAIVNVYPVQATENGNSAEVMEQGELVVTPRVDPGKAMEGPVFAHQQAAVAQFVDNPSALSVRSNGRDPVYDYLILSTKKLIEYKGENDLTAFQEGLNKDGLRSRVMAVEDIQGQGADLIEKIRDYIRAEYQTNGIQFVLLVGDGTAKGAGSIMPARKMWCEIMGYDGAWKPIKEHIPTDLYYGCLDGPFNSNGNNKWGEPNDGEGGKDVDFLSEVAVGRAAVKTPQEMQQFVRKTLWYRSHQLSNKVLLMGETLFKQKNLFGSAYMDQLVGTCTDHGYETTGLGSELNIEKLYDTPEKEYNAEQAAKTINGGGYSFINHLGHCNVNIAMRIYWYGDKPKFTNPDPFFLYTQGCFPGKFTASECWIERLCKSQSGAVAAVANSSYGLGPEDPEGQFPASTTTPGASQMINRQFIHHLFSKGVKQLAWANQKSKEHFVGLTKHQEIRWVFWDANVFGDPSLPFNFEQK